MKRLLVIGMVVMIGVFCSGNGFSATYDATGTWDYSTSGNWVNPGNAGCTADSDETGILTITQTGDSFTGVLGGETATGTVSGTTYSASHSFPDSGGTTTFFVVITLSSSTPSQKF